MNKVILMGRFTGDPELRYTNNNKPVTNFSIAINKRVNGESKADYINCIAWNTTAEFITKYFKKGQAIALVGRLQNRSYEDKEGNKRYSIDVVIEEVEFVGNKPGEEKQTKEDKEKPYREFYEEHQFLCKNSASQ